jgi:hypothetical protein
LTYLKYQNPIDQQALQGGDVSKQMRMLDTKHGGTENKLFKWWIVSTAKEKADKIILKLDIEFKYSKDGHRISRSLPMHLFCLLQTELPRKEEDFKQ